MTRIWLRIKFYGIFILTVVIGLLSALLFRQKRKTEKVESDLAGEKIKGVVNANDKDREMAKQEADALVRHYESLKRQRDEGGAGGDTDL